jgi:hypothetical protein
MWSTSVTSPYFTHPHTAAREHARGVGHRLPAARDDDVRLTCADHLVSGRNGVEAGETHLVDRDRRDVARDAGLVSCRARRVLGGTGLEDLTNDEVVDLLGMHAGLLESTLDGDAAEVDGRQ